MFLFYHRRPSLHILFTDFYSLSLFKPKRYTFPIYPCPRCHQTSKGISLTLWYIPSLKLIIFQKNAGLTDVIKSVRLAILFIHLFFYSLSLHIHLPRCLFIHLVPRRAKCLIFRLLCQRMLYALYPVSSTLWHFSPR